MIEAKPSLPAWNETGGNTILLKEGIEHASIYMDVINFRHSDKIQLIVKNRSK